MTNRVRPVGIPLMACLIALASAASLSAQGSDSPPHLVLDVSPGPASGTHGSFIGTVDDIVYFVGIDGEHGPELWRSDGTPEGTRLLKDINPGGGSALVRHGVGLGSTLYFVAAEPATGDELWRSDGTAAGTTLVKDIRLGPTSSQPSRLFVVGARLFFSACQGPNGCELWTSDGTAAGTVMVKDIRPGSASGLATFPQRFSVLGGRLLFPADDGVNGLELWVSDGTAAGTTMLKDIDPRPVTATQGHSSPERLVTVGAQAFFWANDGIVGRELWKTDGTTTGTVLVRDILPGAAASGQASFDLVGAGEKVFFPARDATAGVELFVSDGTAGGTGPIHEFVPGPSGIDELGDPVEMNGTLFFVPIAFAGGVDNELWRSDGTPEGTVQVVDLDPAGSSAPASIHPFDGTLFFTANDGVYGYELWRSDGTAAGTVRVSDVNPGAEDGLGHVGGKVNGLVLFAAAEAMHGLELWAVDPDRTPIAEAGPDQQIVLDEEVILDGSASFDPDGQELTFEWRDASNAVVSTSATLTVTPPVGTHTYTLTVDDGGKTASDEVLVHVLEEERPTIEVTGVEAGAGVVTTDPPGVTCANTPGMQAFCTLDFPADTSVTLFAEPVAGSTFVGWTGACTGTGTCQVTIADELRVKATFRGPRYLDVAVSGEPSGFGGVTVTPPGATCAMEGPEQGRVCRYPIANDETVTLTPFPGGQSALLTWTGACSGNGPCQVTMSDHRTVGARFTGPRALWTFIVGEEGGTGAIRLEPPDTLCELTAPNPSQFCEQPYALGDVVTLTPVPTGQSVFVVWTEGPCIGSTGPCQVTITDYTSVTATFLGPRELMLGAYGDGTGTIHVDPPGEVCDPSPPQLVCTYPFAQQQVVTLTAQAGPGSTFVGWSLAPQEPPCSGTGPCVVTMSDHLNVAAQFEGPRRLSLTVYGSNGGGSVLITPPGTTCSVAPEGGGTYCPVQEYAFGQHVTLLPTPAPGSEFLGWMIPGCSGTGACELEMTEDRSYSATFQGVNEPPIANAGGPYAGTVGQAVVFDGTGSSDPDGDVLSYSWSFGDGSSGFGPTPSHAYSTVGTFTVTLTVSDSAASSSASAVADITNLPPSVALSSPANGSVFAAPANIPLAATASDLDGSVMLVEFFANGIEIGEDASAPYELAWTDVPAGTYTLTARATDETGTSTDSPPIQIVVNVPDVTLAPTADAYVRDGSSSNTNFGTRSTLEVRKASGAGNNRWTYLKFDTSSVASVSSVRLRLFGNLSAVTGTTVRTQVFSVANTTWSETGIKWNNKPPTGATPLDVETIASNTTEGRWYEWDVTAFVQQQKAVGRDVVAFALKNEANSSPQAVFRSRQSAINRPELVLVP